MLDPREADKVVGGIDPAVQAELAHASAQGLVARGRQEGPADPELIQRLVSLVENEGLETLAQLWAHAPAQSLPGALWRVYALREWVRRDPRTVAERYKLGEQRQSVARVVAGAVDAPGPAEMLQLADAVLSGLFTGELDVALARAAAFARILSTGSALDADWLDGSDRRQAAAVTRRAESLLTTAEALDRAAALWRQGKLE
jgi:hypothetical protein